RAPAEHRLRLLDTASIADGKDGAFVRFAVDARNGRGNGRWQENAITGCVYVESGEVYVRYGKAYRSAGVLLGKSTPPAAGHVCRTAEQVRVAPSGGWSVLIPDIPNGAGP